MHKINQNIKTFPIPHNERWVAVARGPEWAYGQWRGTNVAIVFTLADNPIGDDHDLISGPRIWLEHMLHRDLPLPLLGGESLSQSSVAALATLIDEWVQSVYLSHDEGMAYT